MTLFEADIDGRRTVDVWPEETGFDEHAAETGAKVLWQVKIFPDTDLGLFVAAQQASDKMTDEAPFSAGLKGLLTQAVQEARKHP